MKSNKPITPKISKHSDFHSHKNIDSYPGISIEKIRGYMAKYEQLILDFNE